MLPSKYRLSRPHSAHIYLSLKSTNTPKQASFSGFTVIRICSSLSGSTIFVCWESCGCSSPLSVVWRGVGTQYHMGIEKQLYGELIYEQELAGWWEGDESASPREDKKIFQTLPWISPTQTQHFFLAPVIHHFFPSEKPSIAGASKPMKTALLGAKQLILHPASDAQSAHECQVNPRHPELLLCKWSSDQPWNLENMKPNKSLGTCTPRTREAFISSYGT